MRFTVHVPLVVLRLIRSCCEASIKYGACARCSVDNIAQDDRAARAMAAMRPAGGGLDAAGEAVNRNQDWQLALFLAHKSPGAAAQKVSREAITACARVAWWQLALQVLEDIDGAGLVPDVFCFSSAITACEKGSQWELGVGLLGRMRYVQTAPNVYSFSAAISACEKCGEWQMATQLLSSMLSAGVEPNVISFSASISSCEKGCEWHKALLLMSQMLTTKIYPTVISFNASISACEKAGEWQMALHLLTQIGKAQVLPTVVSFNASISACEKGDQWQMALFLLQLMPATKIAPNAITFAAGIQACAKAREWRTALSLWYEVEACGVKKSQTLYFQALDAFYTERIGFQIFREALAAKELPEMLLQDGAQLDLHLHSCGSAMLAVLWWLAEVVPERLASAQAPKSFSIITGWGKTRESWQTTDVRAAVLNLLAGCRIPSNVKPCNPGRLQVDLSGVDPLSLRAFFPKSEAA